MKKLYFLFLLLSGTILFGQEYRPMLLPDNVWSFSNFSYDFGSGQMHYTDFNYRLSDNKINLNGKEFTGLEFRHRYRIENESQNEWSEWEEASFFLHENIAEKKVYIYYPDDQTLHTSGEFLLYDFNLEIGDFMNLEGFIEGNLLGSVKITDITYESVFELFDTKTYHFENESSQIDFKVYEGISSSHGLNIVSFSWDVGWELTDFGNTLGLIEQSKVQTKISPNPFKDKIQIQNSEEIKLLQLFDLQGKLISSNKNLDEFNSKLSVLNNAIYFLKITFKNNKSETIKLIKNK